MESIPPTKPIEQAPLNQKGVTDASKIASFNKKNATIIGKVTGGAAAAKVDFAALMQANNKHGGANKARNHKDAKHINKRRNEKINRDNEKSY